MLARQTAWHQPPAQSASTRRHGSAPHPPPLQGGVLYVKPKQAHKLRHKPWIKGRFLGTTSTVKVTVCGVSKHTVTAKGEDPLFGEALEFMLGAHPRACKSRPQDGHVRCLPARDRAQHSCHRPLAAA